MREKPNQLFVKLNDIRQVVASAEHFSAKRLKIIFNNSSSRLKDIPGIDAGYISDLDEITNDCLVLLESDQKKSYDTYNSRLEGLLSKIIHDSTPVFAPNI